jgi:3-oxoadipate enol-lactonase
MPTIHANAIDIWYDFDTSEPASGAGGAGPVIALTHGWLGPTAGWPSWVYDLREHARLLVYDVRGQGKTTAPEDLATYSMPQYAADLRALLDAIEIERAHIVGVSQGGMIAAQFAVDYPERTRSLVISDSTAGNGLDEGPGGAWERQLRDAFELMEGLAKKEGLPALCERRLAYDVANDPHYYEHPESAEERQARDRAIYATLNLDTYIGTNRAIRNRPDLAVRIRGLHMPALVMVGEWDSFLPCAERDHRLIEGSRFVLVRRSGHSIDRWRPDVWAPTIAQFIADVEAGRDVAGELER